MPLSHEVSRKIERTWRNPRDRQRVCDALEAYGSEPHEQERERVQLAVLKLSDGSIEKLLEMVQEAGRTTGTSSCGPSTPRKGCPCGLSTWNCRRRSRHASPRSGTATAGNTRNAEGRRSGRLLGPRTLGPIPSPSFPDHPPDDQERLRQQPQGHDEQDHAHDPGNSQIRLHRTAGGQRTQERQDLKPSREPERHRQQ